MSLHRPPTRAQAKTPDRVDVSDSSARVVPPGLRGRGTTREAPRQVVSRLLSRDPPNAALSGGQRSRGRCKGCELHRGMEPSLLCLPQFGRIDRRDQRS
jgi:hypothetical protein